MLDLKQNSNSDISTYNTDNIMDTKKKGEPPKITTPMKLIIDLYKLNGIHALYRGGTLLMLRFL